MRFHIRIKNSVTLLIVLAVALICVSIAVPLFQKSRLRTKEHSLKNILFTLRTEIDEYTFDKKKAPQTLQDLVIEGYLRVVPTGPITGSAQTWKYVREGTLTFVDHMEAGVRDVHSGSDQKSLEGTLYSEW